MYAFENKIEEMLRSENIAGAAVALTDREGIVFSRGFGVESVERPSVPVTADSVFRIASITKVVTGILTMRLVEQGVLDLDRPVRDYIPWLEIKDKAALPLITLRLLLSHRAGFPAEYTPVGPRDEAALEPSLMDAIPKLDLAYFPNEGYTYSNWGTRLVSLAIERTVGRRYSELAREMVLVPLGMNKATFDLNTAATYPLALPHERDESGMPRVSHLIKENFARLATGGIYSSASELTALARLLLNGGVADSGERLISEASLAEMMRINTQHNSGNGYGLTMQMHPLPTGHKTYGHYGNADPYTSAMFVSLESGYGASVMLNTYSKSLRERICDAMLSELVK